MRYYTVILRRAHRRADCGLRLHYTPQLCAIVTVVTEKSFIRLTFAGCGSVDISYVRDIAWLDSGLRPAIDRPLPDLSPSSIDFARRLLS